MKFFENFMQMELKLEQILKLKIIKIMSWEPANLFPLVLLKSAVYGGYGVCVCVFFFGGWGGGGKDTFIHSHFISVRKFPSSLGSIYHVLACLIKLIIGYMANGADPNQTTSKVAV